MRRPSPILTKNQFVREYRKGSFGNRAPTWNTIKEFMASDYQGLVHIRNRVAGGPTWYNVPSAVVWPTYKQITRKVKPESLYFSAMSPHEYNLLQGEVRQSERHLDLFYSTMVGAPMREALTKEPQHASGFTALAIIRNAMDDSSFDWFQELLDSYPGHTLEFSTFRIPWGTIPNRNTVWWEVRGGY